MDHRLLASLSSALVLAGLTPTLAPAQRPQAPKSVTSQIDAARGAPIPGVSTGFTVARDPGAIGLGYDGIRGALRQQCVKRDPSKDVTTPLPSQDFGLQRVRSRHDLRSTMAFDAAASFGIGMFSASASYSTYATARQSFFSNVVLLRSAVGKETRAQIGGSLTDDAIEALKKGAKDFYAVCGTSYIKGYYWGGEFTGSYSLQANETARNSDVQASIDIAVGAFNSGRASLRQTVQDLSSNQALNYQTLQVGGGRNAPPADPDALEKFARDFRADVVANPFPFFALTAGYEGMNVDACGLRLRNRCRANLAGLTGKLAVMYTLAAAQDRGLSIRDTLDEAKEFAYNFWGLNPGDIETGLATVNRNLDAIQLAVSTCNTDPTDAACTTPALDPWPVVSPRRVRWKPIDVTTIAPTAIGDVLPGEKKFVIVRGGWTAWTPATICFNGGENTVIIVQDVATGAQTTYGPPFPVLAGHLHVTARVGDGPTDAQFKDNAPCPPNDPLSMALVDANRAERIVVKSITEVLGDRTAIRNLPTRP